MEAVPLVKEDVELASKFCKSIEQRKLFIDLQHWTKRAFTLERFAKFVK